MKIRRCRWRIQAQDEDERDARNMQAEYVRLMSIKKEKCRVPAYIECVLDYCDLKLFEVMEEDS